MTCQELVELVTSYLEGSLADADARDFAEHLAQCPGCERYLDQFRVTIGLLGSLPEESLSGAAREELLAAFSAWLPRTGGGPA